MISKIPHTCVYGTVYHQRDQDPFEDGIDWTTARQTGTIYGLTRVPYPMENPTARETTQATSPAPYPIIVASSTSVA